MRRQERPDARRLVGREIVDDDVNLPARGCVATTPQEGDEVRARVPRDGLADHFAGLRIERGVERQRAVAEVFKAVTFGAAGRQRQHRVEPVERLNRRLFVDGKDDRVLRRIQIQPDHVRRLLLEIRIVRPHVAFEPMRLQAGAAPRPRDEHVADFSTVASLRVLQCVLPSGGACRVFSRIRASIAGVRTRGGWPAILAVQAGESPLPQSAVSTG